MKKQNGITLMALIITIVIMLILAFIAISSVTDSDILSQTEDASSRLNQLQNTEGSSIDQLINELKPGNSTESGDCEHIEEILAAKAATCTTTGLTEGKKCSVCNEILVVQQIIPASHGEVTINYGKQNDYKHSITEICDICKAAANPTTYEYHDYYPYKGFSHCETCGHDCDHSDGTDYYGKCNICGVEIKHTHTLDYDNYRYKDIEDDDLGHGAEAQCTTCEEWIEIDYSYGDSHDYYTKSYADSNGECTAYNCYHVCQHRDGTYDDDYCTYCGCSGYLDEDEPTEDEPTEDDNCKCDEEGCSWANVDGQLMCQCCGISGDEKGLDIEEYENILRDPNTPFIGESDYD